MTAQPDAPQAPTEPARATGRAWNIVLWALQILLAIAFLFAGGMKLAGVEVTVEMFETIGLGQWFRYFVGVAEVAGAIGLLIPRLVGLAAAALAALLVGAVVTEALIGGMPLAPVPYVVVAVVIAYGRRASLAGLVKRPG
ncbi:MAG: DoxX family protein [Micromonosporaceae bacterium]